MVLIRRGCRHGVSCFEVPLVAPGEVGVRVRVRVSMKISLFRRVRVRLGLVGPGEVVIICTDSRGHA